MKPPEGIMTKYLLETWHYIQYKLIAGIIAAVFTEDFFKLLLLFIFLECLDIFTRWLSLSYQCYKSIYPQTKCGMFKALCFMWQARRWRFINSCGLRDGFCDKMLMYLILLLVGAIVDSAFTIGHAPRLLSTIIVVVLGSTEALSVLENLSIFNGLVLAIKDKFKQKVGN